MEFEQELNHIVELRKGAFRPTITILSLLALGFLLQFLFLPLGLVFGFLAFALFYKSLTQAARMPCPRCGEPFGTKSNIAIAAGGDACQNCGLSITQVQKNKKQSDIA